MGFQVIENGLVLPYKNTALPGRWNYGAGGIVDSTGEFIRSSFVHRGEGKAYPPPPPELIQSCNETVIYIGMFYHVWGHVITDNLRRLWFLKSEDFKNQFKDYPLVYVLWGGERFSIENQNNFRRLLEILEVDVDNLRLIDQPTKFKEIILPDESFYCDTEAIRNSNEYNLAYTDNWTRRFTNEYRETIERIRDFALKNRTPTSIKKVYYFYGRRQFGEERLAEYFKSKGYEIINPANLTLDEQLNFMINCESFASTVGSSSHNLIFLRDNVEAILIPRFNFVSGYQRALDQVHPLNINYIDSTFSIFNRGHNSFFYLISEPLQRFFGDKFDSYTDEDFTSFLDYVKDMLCKGRSVNNNEIKSYGNVLQEFLAWICERKDLPEIYNIPFDFETLQPLFSYQTHVAKKGWGLLVGENQISGSAEDKLDIQAIKINFPSCNVYYSVYFNEKEGWSQEVSNSEIAGTTGKSKSIYGIRIRPDEAGAKEFDILYRVHKFDEQWTPWAKNGETIYSYGQKLNAIQIKLELKSQRR